MNYLKDAHYFQLPSQGNIYTFTSFQLATGVNKVLVGTLKREVYCFEYKDINGVLKPTLKEIPFTYIPSMIYKIISFKKLVYILNNYSNMKRLVSKSILE